MDPNVPDYRDVIYNLSQAIKLDGDFRNSLKETVSTVRSFGREYEKTLAKMQSFSETQLNVKRIETEILNTKVKNSILDNQIRSASRELNERQIKNLNEILTFEQQILQNKEKGLDTSNEEFALDQHIKQSALNIFEEQYLAYSKLRMAGEATLKISKERLESENEIVSIMGVSGKLVSLFGDKLRLGPEIYSAMLLKANQLRGAQSDTFKSWDNLFSKIKSTTINTFKNIIGIPSSIGKWIAEVPKSLSVASTGLFTAVKAFGGPLILLALKKLWDAILLANDQTTKFARTLGISSEQARSLQLEMMKTSYHANTNNHLLTTTKNLIEAQVGLTEALGIATTKDGLFRKDILETQISTTKILGLQADTQAELAKASYLTGMNQEQLLNSILGQVEATKQLTGVGFQHKQVLQEASRLGGVLGLTFGKYPLELTKSLMVIKAMGQDIKTLDSQANSLLNFESSISAEMEAQLLTGRDLNLTRARQLALDNDLSGLALEINKQFGSADQFLKTQRIQAESLANAFGLSRDQLADILKQREFLLKIGLGENATATQQLQKLKELKMTQAEINALYGEGKLAQLTNLSIQEKLSALFEKIQAVFADMLNQSGIVNQIEKLIGWISNPTNVQSIVNAIMWVADKIIQGMLMLGEVTANIGSIFRVEGASDLADELQKARTQFSEKMAEVQAGSDKFFSNYKANTTQPSQATSSNQQSNDSNEKVISLLSQILDVSKNGERIIIKPAGGLYEIMRKQESIDQGEK